ncbi:enoyl-ACP reductase FabV [Candidatus Cardinium hertigii]|uniref:Enoyl-[acyl-carrier-protein] reductase [NADH] n=1 Tax=Candidatus Cardinium hertigii TaxID=247481 RepID=A0A3N2QD01_9BACT|nr:enoyl-ACP reductase FabV [Candidatus Cardinium hertigii]ROT47482.1 trans-2-enoyl-CoA reductase family protein [Candidatus Cardinium hertigii]
MLIEPRIRGFICTTAHSTGCTANVLEQIRYVQNQPSIPSGPKKVLLIGASAGYGLASRIVTAFCAQAQTIGVFAGHAAEGKRTASAGWYNTAAFEQAAHQAGLYAKSMHGNAFSDEIKQKTIALIKQDWGEEVVDCVIYSLASSRRTHPKTGALFNAVLKPIEQPYSGKTIDVMRGHLLDVRIEPATAKEIEDTVMVMGGEDWAMWIDALLEANVLAEGIQTVAYSYIGPKLTESIYTKGTIGQAKKHLAETSKILTKRLSPIGGQAFISVNKALVTQASAAIPVVSIYISLIYKIMKEKKLHEACIEQMYRLCSDRLYRKDRQVLVDAQGCIRMDDWEMQADVQQAVTDIWPKLNNENIDALTDMAGYTREFYKLFGFKVEGVDYDQPCAVDVAIPSLAMQQS